MKYKTFSSTVLTGDGLPPASPSFFPWQPSTWPAPPAKVDAAFVHTLAQIVEETVLDEIGNVIEDVMANNGSLEHRGHVVAIALMCALDAIASYGYRNHHVSEFVQKHFPKEYQSYAGDIYGFYRCSLVHSWNLFEATILPGNEPITKHPDGTLAFGLLNFFCALQDAATDFLTKLGSVPALQTNTLERYTELKATAKP